ncbi:MAG: hypothetical protein ACFFAN_13055 [Promethearchaeota archaeon]
MAIAKKLTIVFIFFYLAVIANLLLFFYEPDVKNLIMNSRGNIASLTEGSNYIWALLIALIIYFIGTALIGFPVPFPFVLFSLSNSIYMKRSNQGLIME